jgi:putative Holliday junction resolvase
LTVIALDVGERRIGTAISDPTETIARPLGVVGRPTNDVACGAIADLVSSHSARLVVVGLPLASDDRLGEQGRRTLAFVRLLRRRIATPVVTWDERYSTGEGLRRLAQVGVRRARRHAMRDAAAAAVILEEWLDSQSSRPARESPGMATDQQSIRPMVESDDNAD